MWGTCVGGSLAYDIEVTSPGGTYPVFVNPNSTNTASRGYYCEGDK